jgi:CPA2 family monovalent cation:H+ antiporter-2
MLSSALVLLGAAILVATVFHSLKLPSIVGLITAGILVGPHGLGLIEALPQVDMIVEVTAVLLMFAIGLEFSLKELLEFRRPILILGVGQIVITIALFTLIFWLGFSMSPEKAIFFSFLIAPSSTAVVLKLLHDSREFETPFGKASFSILLLQDIAIIPMIMAVPFLVSKNPLNDSFFDSLFPLLLICALAIVGLYLLNKYALPFLFHRVAQTRNREIFFFSVLFICMGSAALMHKVGLSVSLGAFIAGMLLAGSNYGKQATAAILPLRDSFLSLFFIAIGMMLDLSFLSSHFLKIATIGIGIGLIKAVIIFAVTWMAGSTGNVSRAVTVLLFQVGEFSFILAELGLRNGLMVEKERQIFVAIAITSLALTPILHSRLTAIMNSHRLDLALPMRWRELARRARAKTHSLMSHPLDMEKMSPSPVLSDHVVIIGFGVAGRSLTRVFEHLQIPYRVIELNAETVRIQQELKVPIIYGDASNLELLRSVGVERARLVAVVTSGVSMLEPILNSVYHLNPNVRVLARTNYLLDLKRLIQNDHTTYVVSELEATIRVVEEALLEFKIEPEKAAQVVSALRAEI